MPLFQNPKNLNSILWKEKETLRQRFLGNLGRKVNRRYGPLRGPTSSSCVQRRVLAKVFF